ncbi:MAG: glutathione S-transferase family protein [Pseudomonadota bacterium]
MYKLIGSPSTRAGRVMWMLEEVGAEYEIVKVGPHDPQVYKVSPTGKLPALTDGDINIIDSTAMLLHIGDREGKLTYPAGSAERAKMMGIISFAVDAIEQPLWFFAKHNFIYPEEFRALDAVKPGLEREFSTAMGVLETMLGDQTFVMGDEFSIADIVLGHLGGWAKGAGFPIPDGVVPEYMQRVRSRPGWKAVLAAREAK